MKKIKTICTWIILTVLLQNVTFGQVNEFIGATVNDSYASINPNISCYNTGTDILYDGNTYRVSAWSGSHAGLSWQVNDGSGPHAGYSFLPGDSPIVHVDVCLVKDIPYNKIYALVASIYTGTYPNYILLDIFEWDGISAFVPILGGVFTAANATTVNIDGDEYGNFALIYDDATSIYGYTGNASGGTLNIDNGGYPVDYFASGIYPDLALFSDANNNIVHFTYIDTNGDLNINVVDYLDLSTNNGYSWTPEVTPVPPIFGDFSWPRIACPNSAGNVDDWTVVWQEDDRTTYLIEGINSIVGNQSSVMIYNDGTLINPNGPGVDISNTPNYQPVVAYDDAGHAGYIWIGWNFTNNSGIYDNAYSGIINSYDYPVVLKCDQVAVPAVNGYLIVPYTTSPYYIVGTYNLSLAGRFASDAIYFSFYKSSAFFDIYSKEITSSTATSLRNESESQSSGNLNLELLKSNKEKLIYLKIHDMQGKLVYSTRGRIDEIKTALENRNNFATNGLYLVSVKSQNGELDLKKKILIIK